MSTKIYNNQVNEEDDEERITKEGKMMIGTIIMILVIHSDTNDPLNDYCPMIRREQEEKIRSKKDDR